VPLKNCLTRRRAKAQYLAAGLLMTVFVFLAALGSRLSIAQTSVPAAAGQPGAATQPADRRISIDVALTDKSGRPIGGLGAGEFTLLDNGQPAKLLDVQAVDTHHTTVDPVHVIIVVDGINTGFDTVAREREQLGEYLKQGGGELAHPTSIAVLGDSGLEIEKATTKDGNALFADLTGTQSKLRIIGRSAGFYGAAERLEKSLGQLSELAAYEATVPGRKMVFFISPGWPMLTNAGIQEDTKQRTWTFNSIAQLNNGLLAAHVVLYCLDPFNLGRTNPFYYQSYLKPVTKVSQAEYPNLALQVMAEHSGGRVLVNGNDIKGEINAAMQDADIYYTLVFEAAPPTEATQFHALRVQLDKPGLTVRTSAGYYVRPGQ
jgi:VWFA-related protein